MAYFVQKVYSEYDPSHGISQTITNFKPTDHYIEAKLQWQDECYNILDGVVDDFNPKVKFDEGDYDGELNYDEYNDIFVYEDQNCGEPWMVSIKVIMIEI